jgi:hypothetical protein
MVKFNKMKTKKAQMKIQQMSFMIIAVFLFFALVGMIVMTVKMNELKNSATTLREQNAKLLVTKLASSPEFSCGEVYGTQKTDCIDLDKVMVLKDSIGKYAEFWGVSSLEVRKIYPRTISNDIECTKTNYPNCNLIVLINKSDSYDKSNFVALCRKEMYKNEVVNKCEMGKLIIGYEEAQ